MLQAPLQPYGRHARHCASLPQCLPAHPSLPAAPAQVLVLSFNSIQRLEGLSELTKLQRLDLAHNQIKKVGAAGSLAPGLLFLCVCKRSVGGEGLGSSCWWELKPWCVPHAHQLLCQLTCSMQSKGWLLYRALGPEQS